MAYLRIQKILLMGLLPLKLGLHGHASLNCELDGIVDHINEYLL